MFIDANQITELIRKYEGIQASSHSPIERVAANAIIKDLEGLIDSEAARLEKMAADFEDEEWGRLEREGAAFQKEAAFLDWPHGV